MAEIQVPTKTQIISAAKNNGDLKDALLILAAALNSLQQQINALAARIP